MKRICSTIILLMQCVAYPSFAAKGHTTNNGGNLAEIRFTNAWNGFAQTMSPCLTAQNFCRLNAAQIRMVKSAVSNQPNMPMVMPVEDLLYHENGEAKSETEMQEIVLLILQDCGSLLGDISMREVAKRAQEISEFGTVKLFRGQIWHVFQREGFFVADLAGIHDFTPKFRSLLRLPDDSKINFSRVWIRNRDGLIEIGGRINYVKEIEKSNGFTLLIAPYEDGTIPPRTDLMVFK